MQVLSGMGGVGKTSLARAYAQRHLDDYGIVWWVRSEDPAAVDAEYRALLEILLPPGEAAKIADARTVAFAHLAKQEHPWLLVLDNVPDPAIMLPPASNGHVLITSRNTGWSDPTAVLPLGDEAAIDLLTSQSGDNDRQSAKALAVELGGLPLALTQAAGFVRASAIDLATYLRLYQVRSAELLKEGRPPDHPHTVATTWGLAMDRLSEPARTLLNLLVFYAPDAIPVYLLCPFDNELALISTVGELRSYGLVTRADSNTVSVHRLVQAVARDRLGGRKHDWADKARALIMAALSKREDKEWDGVMSAATWKATHTHVLALLDHLSPKHANDLIGRSGLYHWTGKTGDPALTRDLFAKSLRVREQLSGAEHEYTLMARRSLAEWTGQAGDAARARDMYAELFPTMVRVLGAEHYETGGVPWGLARWAKQADDPKRARELFAELLPIAEPAFADRPYVAEHAVIRFVRHNLAHWTGEAGDAVRARELFAALVATQERDLGAAHPETMENRQGLAHWTGRAGDAAGARDLYAELLPIQARVWGVDHDYTLATRKNLALWTELAGEAEEAGPGGGGEG